MKNTTLNLAVTSTLLNLRGQQQIIRGLYNESKVLWESLIDRKTRTHLISSITVSNTKSDAINHYIASLSKWVLSAKGGYMRGYSNTAILAKNDEFMTIKGLLSSTPNLTNEKLFTEVLMFFFGYDSLLIKMSIENPVDSPADIIGRIAYVVERFDLAEGYMTDEDSTKTQVQLYMDGLITNEQAEYLRDNLEDICLRTANDCAKDDPIKCIIAQLPG